MTEASFKDVIRAVNEATGLGYSLETSRGEFSAKAILFSEGAWALSRWAVGKDAAETAVSLLAEDAVGKFGFPRAESYEDARLKIEAMRGLRARSVGQKEKEVRAMAAALKDASFDADATLELDTSPAGADLYIARVRLGGKPLVSATGRTSERAFAGVVDAWRRGRMNPGAGDPVPAASSAEELRLKLAALHG